MTRDRCAQTAYYEILRFMGKPVKKAELCTFHGLINALLACGLSVKLVLPPWFLIWPKWLVLFNKISTRKSILSKIVQGNGRRKAVIHYLTAAQLYDISDIWTHIVVELFDEFGNRQYIDPYDGFRYVDYPDSITLKESQERLYGPSGAIAMITGES
jgi:hypothetical protein